MLRRHGGRRCRRSGAGTSDLSDGAADHMSHAARELRVKGFLRIPQQSSGLFEHGSVRRDRARASCTATRLVAGCDAMWRPSPSGRVSCLSEILWSSIFECFLTIFQQASGLFEHGSVRRDRAHAVCIATRLAAVCDAMWRPSPSDRVTGLSETL